MHGFDLERRLRVLFFVAGNLELDAALVVLVEQIRDLEVHGQIACVLEPEPACDAYVDRPVVVEPFAVARAGGDQWQRLVCRQRK